MPPDALNAREELFREGGVEFRLLLPRAADELIDEQAFAQDERLPYWADLWPSSRALARWLLAQRLDAATRTIELGCGVGLPALALSSMGLAPLATDYEPAALRWAEANAARNDLRPLRTALLDWRHPGAIEGLFDLLVAADVLYEQRNAATLVSCLDRLTAPGGRFIVADPGRRWLPHFQLLMRQAGWRGVETAVLTEHDSDGKAKPATVRILEWRRASA